MSEQEAAAQRFTGRTAWARNLVLGVGTLVTPMTRWFAELYHRSLFDGLLDAARVRTEYSPVALEEPVRDAAVRAVDLERHESPED